MSAFGPVVVLVDQGHSRCPTCTATLWGIAGASGSKGYLLETVCAAAGSGPQVAGRAGDGPDSSR
jgi:hypothetical protein